MFILYSFIRSSDENRSIAKILNVFCLFLVSVSEIYFILEKVMVQFNQLGCASLNC